jgi:hypothetical protein
LQFFVTQAVMCWDAVVSFCVSIEVASVCSF